MNFGLKSLVQSSISMFAQKCALIRSNKYLASLFSESFSLGIESAGEAGRQGWNFEKKYTMNFSKYEIFLIYLLDLP